MRMKGVRSLREQALLMDVEQDDVVATRVSLARAVEYLVAHQDCSAEEAQARIWQEARAKRVSLDKIVKAIVAGETVNYHYNVPI